MVMDAIAEHGAQGRLAAPTRSDVGSTAIILGWTGETPDWLTNAAEIAGAKTGIVVVIKSARHTQDELMSIVSDKLHPLAPVGALTDIAIDIDRIVVRGANLPELSARRDTVATDWFPFFAKVDELSRIGIVVDFESRDQLRYQP